MLRNKNGTEFKVGAVAAAKRAHEENGREYFADGSSFATCEGMPVTVRAKESRDA